MSRRVSLRDVASQIDYGLTTSATDAKDGPKFLRITDIDKSFIEWGNVPHCVATPEQREKYALQSGDIVVARTGASTGRSQWVQVEADTVFASYLVRFRIFPDYDSRFIGYVLNSRAWKHYVDSVAHGKSAQPNMSASIMADFEFDCPPLSKQRAIAEVLGALDDKIAANNACIRLIDEHLAAEYERSLQQEKIVEELGVIAEFHNKRRIPLSAKQRDERPGAVPYYGASGVFGYVDEALFDEPLVLVGEDGSVINADGTPVTQYIWGPSWVNNHAHALKGKVVSTELLYYAIRRSQVSTLVTGAVQPKINMGNLKRLQLSLPALESRTSMETIVAAEVAAKRAFTTEKRTLTATRDALLPQLMSGKMRVRDAEAVVEDVL